MFVVLLVTIAVVCMITLPTLFREVRALVAHEPQIRESIARLLERTRMTAALGQSVRDLHYDAMARAAAGFALSLLSRAIEIGAYIASSIFLALYLVIDRDRLRGGMFAIVPRAKHMRLSRLLVNLETIVSGCIRGQVMTSALMTTFVFLLLAICRVPDPLPIAIFAGLADVLPYVGCVLSVVPAALAASPKGFWAVAAVVAVMLAYEEFESRFLVPRIYGRALRLPSSVVLIALLVGGTLMGIVGALLALPVTAAIRMGFEEWRILGRGEPADEADSRQRDINAESEYARCTAGVPASDAAAIAIDIAKKYRKQETAG